MRHRTVTRERLLRLADLGEIKVQILHKKGRKQILLARDGWCEEYTTLKEAAAFCRGYVRGQQDAEKEG